MSSSVGPTSRATGRDDNGSRSASGADNGLPGRESRRTVVHRQKEEHGGVKLGSAFFGFLAAIGVGVLLTAILSAAGAAVGLASDTKPAAAASTATKSASTIGIVGGIILLVILFVAYYCGGYVAARMARFNGMKQGIAVWVWALIVAVAVAVLGAVAGNKFNILAQLNSFPRIPISEGDVTTGGIIALLVIAAASLAGAVLGGLAGMRFHRKVDKTGLGA
jgi:hypothetical protein